MSAEARTISVTSEPIATDVVGLRIHSHTSITPQWLASAAVPVWREAHDGGRRRVVLRRGWVGGPHVEIVASGPGAATAPWRSLARQADAGPAPDRPLDSAAYLDTARERGRLENVPPPYLPLQAHGAVTLLTQDAQGDGSSFAELRTLVDAALAPAVVGLVAEAAQSPASTPARLVGLLTTVAQVHLLGAGYGTFSLRSHAEALLSWLAPSKDLRPAFQERYAAQREALVAEVGGVLGGAPSPTLHDWSRTLGYAAGVVDAHVRLGRLAADEVDSASSRVSGQEGPPGAPEAGPRGEHPDTDFHRVVYGSGVTDLAGEWFTGYRFLVNRVYSQLPLLGISPLQRAFACFAVSEAVDELLGESWTERLTTGAGLAEVRHD